MAELESNLRTFLLSKSGVNDEISTRLYVDRKDSRIVTAYPYAIIRTVQEAPGYAHDGALPDSGLYQIDVYSDSKTTVNSATTAIRAELTGFSGALSGVTAGAVFVTDTRGGFDPDVRVFRRSTDYQIRQNG